MEHPTPLPQRVLVKMLRENLKRVKDTNDLGALWILAQLIQTQNTSSSFVKYNLGKKNLALLEKIREENGG